MKALDFVNQNIRGYIQVMKTSSSVKLLTAPPSIYPNFKSSLLTDIENAETEIMCATELGSKNATI